MRGIEKAAVFLGFVADESFAGLDAFVAAHGDAGAVIGGGEEADDVHDHWRFAGSADGEVSDADDRDVEIDDALAGVEASVSQADDAAVDSGDESSEWATDWR